MPPDLLVAFGQVVLTLFALATLHDPATYINRRWSLSAAAGLVLIVVGLFMLSAPVSAAVAAIAVVAWLGVFAIRGTQHGLC